MFLIIRSINMILTSKAININNLAKVIERALLDNKTTTQHQLASAQYIKRQKIIMYLTHNLFIILTGNINSRIYHIHTHCVLYIYIYATICIFIVSSF